MFTGKTIFTILLGVVSASCAYATVIHTGPGPVVTCSCPVPFPGDNTPVPDIFVGYKCAYPTGSCIWNVDGGLTTVNNTDCPTYSPCPNVEDDVSNICACPTDLNGAYGIYEGDFFAYTCDFVSECTYDSFGNFLNGSSVTCPSSSAGCDFKVPLIFP